MAETEYSKCVFCGFCENTCPTLHSTGERGYGPRGRVRVVGLLLKGVVTPKTVEYLYTCLLCYACLKPCPAGVDIPKLVVAGRQLLTSKYKEQNSNNNLKAEMMRLERADA